MQDILLFLLADYIARTGVTEQEQEQSPFLGLEPLWIQVNFSPRDMSPTGPVRGGPLGLGH